MSSIVKCSYIYCTKCCAVQQVYKREPRGHAGNVLSKIFFRWKEPWWSSTRCFEFLSAISLFVPFCSINFPPRIIPLEAHDLSKDSLKRRGNSLKRKYLHLPYRKGLFLTYGSSAKSLYILYWLYFLH